MAGRRKQRYAASSLDASWNLSDSPAPDDANHATQQSQSMAASPDALLSPSRGTSASAQAQQSRSFESLSSQHSQLPAWLDTLEPPRGSTPSRHSRDGDESASASTVSSSAPSRTTRARKKRYATQHSADWLEDDLPPGADAALPVYYHPPSPSVSGMQRPLPGAETLGQPQLHRTQPSVPPSTQPQALTTPSSVATTSPALSIFRGGGGQTYSPGQDAPAIQPSAPSAYSPASPFAGQNQNTQASSGQQGGHGEQAQETGNLGVIVEEEQLPANPPPPPLPHHQPLPAQRRKGWSRLLKRG